MQRPSLTTPKDVAFLLVTEDNLITGCRVAVPPFWTNTTQITFNFTGFQSPSPLQFRWGLGTVPSFDDSIPFTAFTGQLITNADFIAGGHLLQGVTVFQQDYALDSSRALQEGQDYYVTVQALDPGFIVVAQATGAPVKVCIALLVSLSPCLVPNNNSSA